jgi:hypothetical protein
MSTTAAASSEGPSELSIALVHLFKGPVYRDKQGKVWAAVLKTKAAVLDYLAALGLEVFVDENEGYAFVRSSPDRDEALPQLIRKHRLPRRTSLMVALLRKRLLEFDAANAGTLLVMTKDQIVDMMRLFVPERSNDVQLVGLIDRDVKRVEDLGFLRRRSLQGQPETFEVDRILIAFGNAHFLGDLDTALQEYLNELASELTAELTEELTDGTEET